MKFVDSKRSAILLAFSAVLALIILFTFYVQTRIIEHSESDTYAKVFYEDRNSSIFGRKLASGRGDYFLDIHYSKPTARFQLPQLEVLPPFHELWAIHHGTGCPNGYTHTNGFETPVPSSEVCLTLNIYRCQQSQVLNTGLQPVLVYLNEGNWLGRSDANLEPQTTIHNLACRGMIIVSVNYRMGVYGFYSTLNEVNAKNFGLHDVDTALQWINANIAKFGGHPQHVTVMGRGIGAEMASVLSKRRYGNKKNFVDPVTGAHTQAIESVRQKYKFRHKNEFRHIFSLVVSNNRDAVELAETARTISPSSQWKLASENILKKHTSNHLKTAAMPVLMGLCHRPVEKPTTPSGFKPVKTVAQLEQLLKEQIDKIPDFNASFVDPSKALDYYLELFKQEEFNAKDEKELFHEVIHKIKFDVFQTGPMILEAFNRWNTPNSARVYMFDYEAPWWLKTSELDVASTGEKLSFNNFPDASLELPCIDQLLFNPIPKRKLVSSGQLKLDTNSNESSSIKLIDTSYHQRLIAETFAEYLGNFVTYGDPNIGDEEEASVLPGEWPTVSFTAYNSSTETSRNIIESKLKVLRLNDRQGALIDELLEIGNDKLKFWLCQLASVCKL